MQDTAPDAKKRNVNVSIDATMVAEAKTAGMNLSAILEQALRAELKLSRETKWREDNRQAIEASNTELESNGLWCDDHRVW